jgi:hypothetical protein
LGNGAEGEDDDMESVALLAEAQIGTTGLVADIGTPLSVGTSQRAYRVTPSGGDASPSPSARELIVGMGLAPIR